ncbi:MAG TPA: RidA family protein [Gemmatimonadaceae bacterium]|nr:RidA family protein [Gemmatimonadaceae bacterium]
MSIAPRDEPESSEVLAIREMEKTAGPELIQPEGWPRPKGYANAAVASGRYAAFAGQVGWDPVTCAFDTDDFAGQTRQALHNIVQLLLAAGARPHDLIRLTWYILDRREYMSASREIGAIYREIIGDHYPAMSVIVVSGFLEERARVEIEATAVIPEHPV